MKKQIKIKFKAGHTHILEFGDDVECIKVCDDVVYLSKREDTEIKSIESLNVHSSKGNAIAKITDSGM